MRHLLVVAIFLAAGCFPASAQETPPPGGTGDRSAEAFTGYYNITDLGMLVGSPRNSNPAPFSFMTINGWHFTRQLGAGLGVGLEFLGGSYLPIVVDMRYYVRETAFSPYFFLQGGYAVPLDAGYSGGTIWYDAREDGIAWNNDYIYRQYKPLGGALGGVGFGIRNLFTPNFGVLMAVGYRFEYQFFRTDSDWSRIINYNRLMLKVGIIFR